MAQRIGIKVAVIDRTAGPPVFILKGSAIYSTLSTSLARASLIKEQWVEYLRSHFKNALARTPGVLAGGDLNCFLDESQSIVFNGFCVLSREFLKKHAGKADLKIKFGG